MPLTQEKAWELLQTYSINSTTFDFGALLCLCLRLAENNEEEKNAFIELHLRLLSCIAHNESLDQNSSELKYFSALKNLKTPQEQLKVLCEIKSTDNPEQTFFEEIVANNASDDHKETLLRYQSELHTALGIKKTPTIDANFKLKCLSAIMAAGGAVLCAIAAVYMSPVLAAVGGVMLVGGLIGLGYSFFSGGSSSDAETEQADPSNANDIK
ncbi:MAG: hypothetical protein QNK11_08225 [Legionella sp.]|nr:hypothetical protein [Legionella sp.]